MNAPLHPIFASILKTHADAAIGTAAAVEEAQRREYEELLRRHDWRFEWCDDGRVRARGRDERQKLRELRARLDPHFDLWNLFAPVDYQNDRNICA